MKIYVCDKCGKEVKEQRRIRIVDGSLKAENALHDVDMCDSCFSELQEFMKPYPSE